MYNVKYLKSLTKLLWIKILFRLMNKYKAKETIPCRLYWHDCMKNFPAFEKNSVQVPWTFLVALARIKMEKAEQYRVLSRVTNVISIQIDKLRFFFWYHLFIRITCQLPFVNYSGILFKIFDVTSYYKSEIV